MSNAFNSVSRNHLREIPSTFPEIYDYVSQMYDRKSHLVYVKGNETVILLSKEGVHQGEPLGPTLFASAIQPILKATQEKYEDVTILAYLDDIFVVGEVDRVLCALTDLKSSLVNIGLRICERKCELYSTFIDNESSISIPVTTQGTVILGVLIGCKEFVQNWCNEFAVSGRDLCSKLANLDNPQASTLLLRHCHIPRVNYLARAVFPKWLIELLRSMMN